MTDTSITPSPTTPVFINKFEPEYLPMHETKSTREWIKQFKIYENAETEQNMEKFLKTLVLPKKENISRIVLLLAKENALIQEYQDKVEHYIQKSGYDVSLLKHWWNYLSSATGQKLMPKYSIPRRRYGDENDTYDG